jgi:glycosyltransferase involved in cell wall biosynthesis
MLPLISVIVPAYNEGLYIETTLRSLSNQSMDRQVYEIIVVDGSSNDETVDIASCYADLSWIKGDMIIMTGWRLREDYARQDYLHTAVNRQCLKSRTETSC